MTLPGSNRQRDRLGARLAASDAPSPEDLEALHQLLGWYAESLDRATPRMRLSTGLEPTSRVKNTGTILEKLRRNTGSGLSSTQDLAGARIIGDFRSSADQDAVVERLVAEFADAPKPPRVFDRRARPSHGYRAVHVIVYPDGVPIEIQVRSRLQHDWAERFEKFADLVGRDVRYGGAPTFPGLPPSAAADPLLTFSADRVLRSLLALGRMIAAAESRAPDRVGAMLALRDRWIVARAFSAVESTVDRLEDVLQLTALGPTPPGE